MSYIDALSHLKFKTTSTEIEGITFYLREISLGTRLKYEKEQDNMTKILKMMYASLCDEDGNLTEKEENFDRFVAVMPERVLKKLVDAFTSLNYPNQNEDKDLKN